MSEESLSTSLWYCRSPECRIYLQLTPLWYTKKIKKRSLHAANGIITKHNYSRVDHSCHDILLPLTHSSASGGFGKVGANLLLCRIRAPYLRKMTGIGTRRIATQPSRVPAQLTPRALNMYIEKRGKTAPASDRRKVFAAIADAALRLFSS